MLSPTHTNSGNNGASWMIFTGVHAERQLFPLPKLHHPKCYMWFFCSLDQSLVHSNLKLWIVLKTLQDPLIQNKKALPCVGDCISSFFVLVSFRSGSQESANAQVAWQHPMSGVRLADIFTHNFSSWTIKGKHRSDSLAISSACYTGVR
jgi:hypothetical protein